MGSNSKVIAAEIRVFGQCQVLTAAGQDVTPPRAKSQALLAMICLSPGGRLGRSRAADLLWGDSKDRFASLRQAVAQLRRCFEAVGPSVFTADKTVLRIDLSRVRIDALVAEAGAIADDPGNILWLAEGGLGGLLEQLDVEEEGFRGWLGPERERRRRELSIALDLMLAAVSQDRSPDKVQMLASAILRVDPNSERAHRSLIRVHAGRGDLSAALNQYRSCADGLWRELGVEPSPQTQALAVSLISARPPAEAFEATVARREVTGSAGRPVLHLPSPVASDAVRATRIDPEIFRRRIAGEFDRAGGLDVVLSPHLCGLETPGLHQQRDAFLALVTLELDAGCLVASGQLQNPETGQLFGSFLTRCAVPATDDEIGGAAEGLARRFLPLIDQLACERAAAKPLKNLSAAECILRARPLIFGLAPRMAEKALELLNQAIDIDPCCGQGYLWSAFLWSLKPEQGWSNDPEGAREEVTYLVRRGIELSPGDCQTLALAGHMEAFVHHDFRSALELFDTALSINPASGYALNFSAITQCYIGRPETGLRRLAEGRRLMTFDPHPYYFDTARTIALFLAGKHDSAVRMGQRVLRNNSSFSAIYRPMIASLGYLGQTDRAEPLIDAARRFDGDFSLERFLETYPPLDASLRQHYAEGLRRAGL